MQDEIGNVERRQEDTLPIHTHYVSVSWRMHPVIMETNALKLTATMNCSNGKNDSSTVKCECNGLAKRNYLAKVSRNNSWNNGYQPRYLCISIKKRFNFGLFCRCQHQIRIG